MTFVTPLLSDHAHIKQVEERLKALKEDGTIREYIKVDGLKSHVITQTESKEVPFPSVWFTGMYKDYWDAPPTIEIMDDVINVLAWCSDEGRGGYERR